MSFTDPQPSTRILVTGKTGSGKSSRVKEAMRAWLSKGVRVIAVDVCDEYSRHGQAKYGLVQLGPLRHRVTAAELVARPGLVNDARLSLSVVPPDRSARSWARTFMLVERLMRDAGKAVIVVDEVGTWANMAGGPECAKARASLESFSTNGRKDGLALVTVAQCASQIPKLVRSQATEWWTYLQDEPADVDALAERFGRERAEQVSRLALYECIEWRDATNPQPHKKPALRVAGA